MIPIVMGTVVGHICYNLGAQGQKLALSFSLFSCPRQFFSWLGIPAPRCQSLPYKTICLGSNLFLYIPSLHLGPTARSLVHCDRDPLCPKRKSLSGLRRHHRSDASFLPFSCTWCWHYKEKDKHESENWSWFWYHLSCVLSACQIQHQLVCLLLLWLSMPWNAII